MLSRVRANLMTRPYREWVDGYDLSLDAKLEVKQFAGTLSVSPTELVAGQPFTLRVELQNTGLCPWMAGTNQYLLLTGEAQRLGLPERVEFADPWMVFGDTRTLELPGKAPAEPGEGSVTAQLFSQYRNDYACAAQTVKLSWK
jgi:hypothetical protein